MPLPHTPKQVLSSLSCSSSSPFLLCWFDEGSRDQLICAANPRVYCVAVCFDQKCERCEISMSLRRGTAEVRSKSFLRFFSLSFVLFFHDVQKAEIILTFCV